MEEKIKNAVESYPDGWVGTGNIRAIHPDVLQMANRFANAWKRKHGGRKPRLEFCVSLLIIAAQDHIMATLESMEE